MSSRALVCRATWVNKAAHGRWTPSCLKYGWIMGAHDWGWRILDSMLLQGNMRLSHKVLCTLMAEVTAIMNARPLIPVSIDPDSPFIRTPAMMQWYSPRRLESHLLLGTSWTRIFSADSGDKYTLTNRFWTHWSHKYLPTAMLPKVDQSSLKPTSRWWCAVERQSSCPQQVTYGYGQFCLPTNQGSARTYLRQVSEVVLLLPKKDSCQYCVTVSFSVVTLQRSVREYFASQVIYVV